MGVLIPTKTMNAIWHSSVDSYWTVPTPSSASYIVYVSEDGDDSTGATYTEGVFSNVFEPDFEPSAFATFATAYEQVRDGYADYVLFKRGDTFTETLSLDKWGSSGDERFVIGAYGTSGDSPLFLNGANQAITQVSDVPKNIYILGLDFYAHTRDPDNEAYTGIQDYNDEDSNTGVYGSAAFGFNHTTSTIAENILLEGCRWRFFAGTSVAISTDTEGSLEVNFRRCVWLNNYTIHEGSHCQGFWGFLSKITMDECIMDHNGWQGIAGTEEPGQATQFNHNTYFAGCYDTSFTNCIFTRGSSMNNKFTGYPGDEDTSPNIVLNNNFYLGGEIAIQIGGNCSDAETYGGNYRFEDLQITNNVVQDAGWENPLGRLLGWGFYIEGMNSGEVSNNVVAFTTDTSSTLTNSNALYFKSGYLKGLTVDSNVFSSPAGGSALIYEDANEGEATDDITLSNNIFNMTTDESDYVIRIEDDRAWNFSSNWYYTPRTSNEFLVSSSAYQKADWLLDFDTTGTFGNDAYVFPDETKTIETYMSNLGEDETKDSFITKIRTQNRYDWDSDISAQLINTYIKTGWVG